jgi:Vanadium chloroperoxidase N-terminal domain/PAP2 superfamily
MPDPILLWNEVALEANRVSHTNGKGEQAGPPLSARALAIVHLAMYDAVAGVVNDDAILPYYLTKPPTTAIDDIPAAVAAAARKTLATLFPSQTPLFDSVFAGVGSPDSDSDKFGEKVAQRILDAREADPGAGSVTYKPSAERGRHRPDPDNAGQGFHAPDYGKLSKAFAVGTRYDLAPPPFDNEEYHTALREVLGKGIKPELMGTLPDSIEARTPDETLIGTYWGYDGALELGTPPRLYNQIIRKIATKRHSANDVVQNARLFALVNAALADAGILCWDQKYIHDFWRPVVGIREHDKSMGPVSTDADDKIDPLCDPFWLPLGGPNTNNVGKKNFTPPFPSYPSGHATFGAAAFHITRLFYNDGGTLKGKSLKADKLFDGLSFVSEELNGINTDNNGTVRPRHIRSFPHGGLFQMVQENGRGRVYLGVHWVFDAFVVDDDGEPDLTRTKKVDGKVLHFGGVPLGLLIAEDIFERAKTKNWHSTATGPRSAKATAKERTNTHGSRWQPDAQAR